MRWSLPTRVAFRFSVVYFGLYGFATQVAGGVLLLPGFAVPALGTEWPMREITTWCARHLFGVDSPLLYRGNSGDTLFFWVQTFWLLAVAVLATAVWSWADRQRDSYLSLHKWFRLSVRFGLAAQMFYYGMAKVIPTQFPSPALVTLVERVGNLSLTDVLWISIGASTPYQIFTGCAEVLGGLLLLTPRTTTLGALVCLASLIQVFVLNMTYDFGLKQISFHLMLMSVILLAPDLRRMASVFVLDRAVEASGQPPLFHTARANRLALLAQVVFGLYLAAMFAGISVRQWNSEGGGAPKSPLYGIWDVEELSIDGEVRSPLMNDYDRRWRRVIFDAPQRMAFQRTDDSFSRYGVSIDVDGHTLALTKGSSRDWKAGFSFERQDQNRLILDGTMDGYRIHMRLRRVELDTFRLLNSPFRWIRPSDAPGT